MYRVLVKYSNSCDRVRRGIRSRNPAPMPVDEPTDRDASQAKGSSPEQPSVFRLRDLATSATASAPALQRNATSGTDFRSGHLHPSSFAEGTVLAERFRLVRFIAHGGMGEVYEADDLELGERVAIKTLLPSIAKDARALERFKREIQLARRVTHPNVCRVNDVFRHVGGEGGREEAIVFLSMELLNGESLSDRVRTQGRLSPPEALPIAQQMAQGLSAAHKVGIIHRDFKSGNVILVRENDGSERAVITDFGLARAALDDSTATGLTGATDMLGTPLYMAPEQVLGEEITVAADIFAFGVVLYEMVTGTWPFLADTRIATALKRVQAPPVAPVERVPELDPRWNDTILVCLRRHPNDRYQRATEVVRALGGEAVSAPVLTPAISTQRKTAQKSLAVATAVIITIIAAAMFFARGKSNTTPPTARAKVAVLDLKNASGNATEDWIGIDLARTLSDDLAVGNQLLVPPTRELLQVASDLHVQGTESLPSDAMDAIRTRLGAKYVVTGSYTVGNDGKQILVQVKLSDLESGKQLASVAESGTVDDLFRVAIRPSSRIREELGVSPLTAAQAGDLQQDLPSGAAAKAFSDALSRLKKFDTQGAIPLLEKAVSAAPTVAIVHSVLAQCWADLGYEGKAQDESRKAFDLSANDVPDRRLPLEAEYLAFHHEWGTATERYRTLWSRYPEDREYALKLASTQISAGHGHDAIDTLSQLKGRDAEDPRVDLAKADAFGSLADFAAERDAAAKAAKTARKYGFRLLLARATQVQCWAQLNLGKPREAIELCEESRALSQEIQNLSGVARATNNIANALWKSGDSKGAKEKYAEAVKITSEIGDKLNLGGALMNYANMLSNLGDLDGALKYNDQALQVAIERGTRIDEARTLNNIAGILNRKGDLAGAEIKYGEALEKSRDVGDQNTVARVLYNLAVVQSTRGELAGAMTRLQESLAIRQQLGLKSAVAGTEELMGEILAAQDQLPQAKTTLESALSTQLALKEANNAAYTRMQIATVELELGKLGEAEALFRQVVADFEEQSDDDDRIVAACGLARTLLSSGRASEAGAELAKVAKLAKTTSDKSARITYAVVNGLGAAALGKTNDAKRLEDAALSDSSRTGMTQLAFEARRASAYIALKSGQGAAARQLLSALAEESDARGFKLIARKSREQMP